MIISLILSSIISTQVNTALVVGVLETNGITIQEISEINNRIIADKDVDVLEEYYTHKSFSSKNTYELKQMLLFYSEENMSKEEIISDIDSKYGIPPILEGFT